MSCINKYSLSDYKNIHENMYYFELSDKTIEIINKLAMQVGAPNYIKTPQFRHKRSNNYKHRDILNSETDLNMMNSFHITEFNKSEGLDKHLENIRNHLNKLSNISYTKIITLLFNELDNVDESLIEDVSKEIFKIIKNNSMFPDIYAKLYGELIKKNIIFFNILKCNQDNFETNIMSTNYDNPEEDYNKLCEYNKNNDIKKVQAIFYVNLMKESIIESKYMYDICMYILSIYNKLINDENKKHECDSLSEIFYVIYINSYEFFDTINNQYNSEIISEINKITLYKISKYKSLTNKSIFKFMDIIDEMN